MPTNQTFVRVLFAALARLPGLLFGRISWSAPPWVVGCGRRLTSFQGLVKAHPRAVTLSLCLLVALATGGLQGWRWWASHKPRTFAYNALRDVEVTAEAPAAVAAGAPDKDLKPGPLRVRFAGAPVAPLEKIGKDATEAVSLTPKTRGKWTWQNGSTLAFQPDDHWPPDTRFTVTLRPAALAEGLHLDKASLTVRT
ncbi:MAG: Ig-like domain-containing protein, partial [Verrucomicrobiota bacterium]